MFLMIVALVEAPIAQGQVNTDSLGIAVADSSSQLPHLAGLDNLHLSPPSADSNSSKIPSVAALGSEAKGLLPGLVDPLQGHRPFHTTGQVEMGGINGRIPYSAESDGPWNAYAKGNVSVELFGVPVGVLFDLGTDVPIRGRRNTVRIAFDPQRALGQQHWDHAIELQQLHSRLDSMDVQRALKYRELLGQEARIAALKVQMPDRAIPSLELPDTGIVLPNIHGPVPIAGALPALPDASELDPSKLDSMKNELSELQGQLSGLDQDVQTVQMRIQRLGAVVNAEKGKNDLLTSFTQGIKRFEIGSCSPTSSEFLINGINFQGLSFEYARKDLFLAFDRGRSFDDTWQDADPVSHDLRTLQQSLFFADASDLNPRKLTAAKAGFGSSQGTHFHVGYLTGSREDVPMGVTVPDGTGATLRNHVVELDLGYALLKNSLLHLVYARSTVRSSSGIGNEDQETEAVDGLFNFGGNNDQAVKLGWSTTIERTGTRAEVEVRSISPFFQSFGMGYIRNGSKAMEGRLDQKVGKRLRLRGRYTLEDRTSPGEPEDQVISLERAQGQMRYRVNRSLTLRAGYIPVHTRTGTSDSMSVESRNRNYTLGGNVRKRWRSVVMMISADEGLYSWMAGDGQRQVVENHNVSISLVRSGQWSAQLTWTGLGGGGDSLITATDNVSIQGNYHICTHAVCRGAVQLPSGEPLGWMCALEDRVSEHFALGLKGESYSRSDLYFAQEEQLTTSNTYNWTASVTYTW
jgi:hypothetical protein